MPLFSVILPLHNRAAELPQTVRSVRAQTLADWELLIINDHSTDGADQAALGFAKDDARIAVHHLPETKRGAPAARNLGLTVARGEFVIFLDSDDLLSPDALEHRFAALRAKPDLDFVVSRCQLFRHEMGDIPHLWNADTGQDDLDRFLRTDVPWQTTGPTWRRSSLSKVVPPRSESAGAERSGTPRSAALDRATNDSLELWDEQAQSGQDWEFHIRVLLSGLCYERLDRVDCHWRVPSADRESIGKQSHFAAHARARPHVLRNLLATFRRLDRLDGRAVASFAAVWFQAAETLAIRASRKEGRALWREAFDAGLIDRARHRQGDRYLFALRWPERAEALRQKLERHWPADAFVRRAKFYNRAPVSPDHVPAVSVVVSAYNNEAYVRRAIESIQRQTFRDFELIVINDGSTDSTGTILRELAESDCRIRLVDRGNKGLTASLNEGVRLARAPIVARMDADDIALPTRFEKQFAYLREHPDCVLLGTGVMLIDPYDTPIIEGELHVEHDAIDRELLKGRGGALYHPTVMIRRDVLLRLGAYREAFDNSEDLDLFLRLAEVGRVHNLPEVLLHYRRHPGSVNHTKFANQQKIKSAIVAEAYERRGLAKPEQWSFNPWTPKPHAEQWREWGWNALRRGKVAAARKLARHALRSGWTNLENWRLFACALRGR